MRISGGFTPHGREGKNELKEAIIPQFRRDTASSQALRSSYRARQEMSSTLLCDARQATKRSYLILLGVYADWARRDGRGFVLRALSAVSRSRRMNSRLQSRRAPASSS